MAQQAEPQRDRLKSGAGAAMDAECDERDDDVELQCAAKEEAPRALAPPGERGQCDREQQADEQGSACVAEPERVLHGARKEDRREERRRDRETLQRRILELASEREHPDRADRRNGAEEDLRRVIECQLARRQ